jgi:hypothetical protein
VSNAHPAKLTGVRAVDRCVAADWPLPFGSDEPIEPEFIEQPTNAIRVAAHNAEVK